MPSLICRSIKLKISDAMIGTNVNARKPTIHGERKAKPCLNSRRAIGAMLRNDFKDGMEFRKFDSCSNMGCSLNFDLILEFWRAGFTGPPKVYHASFTYCR